MDSKELENIIPIPSIWENLKELEKRLIQVSSSSDAYLTEISQYLISAGGKRFRPLISLPVSYTHLTLPTILLV